MDRLKKIYSRMIQKTENKNDDRFHKYGAKNIKMCDEWRNSYDEFEKWALNNGFYEQDSKIVPLKNLLSIDRIDPKGNYTPENCQWITYSENSGKDKRLLSSEHVRKVRVLYEAGAKISEIAKVFEVKYGVIYGIVANKTYRNVK